MMKIKSNQNKNVYFQLLLISLLVVISSMSANAIDTTDLVSYWKFDETSSSTTADDAHGSNDGTITGTINRDGIIERGVYLNGNNNFIDFGAGATLFDYDVSSWSFWIKPGRSTNYVLGNSRNNANAGMFTIYTRDGKVEYHYVSTGGATGITHAWQTDDVVITNNVWNHVVIVRNHLTNELNIYVNGSSKATSLLSGDGSISTRFSTDTRFYIGKWYGTPDGTAQPHHRFLGDIDEVAIWNRALTSTEVSDLYNSGSGLAYPFSSGPSVSTSAATSITSVGATLNGDLTDLDGESSVDVSFRYRERDSTGAWTTTSAVSKTATGTFNEAITGLSYNEEYEYQAVVEWGTTDEAFGALTYFTTLNPTVSQPSITTGNTYDASYYNGEITIRSSIFNFDSPECQYSVNNGGSWLSATAVSNLCEKTGLSPNADINIKFRARSGSTGAWVESATKSYTYDATAPSSLTFNPTSRAWDNTNAEITLSATDTASGIDYSSLEVCITGNDPSVVPCTPVPIASLPAGISVTGQVLTISDNGAWAVCFSVDDNLGTSSSVQCSGEDVFQVDKTTPTTSGEITSGSAIDDGGVNDGVYYTDVVYTITPADTFSGVDTTSYCVDAVNSCTPNLAYTTPITINTNGDHYVRFTSTDVAGNVQTTQSSGLIERDDTLVTFFSAILTDAYTELGINSFCMDIRNPSTGTLFDTFCTTTGTITTTYEYAVEDYNLSFYDIGGVGSQTHFDFSTIHTINEDFSGEAAQAYLDLNVVEIITGNTISTPYSFKISAVTYSDTDLPLAISAGEHTLEFLGGASYLDKNITFNISTLENKLLDVELGNTLLKINLTDIVTASLLEVTSYMTVNNNAGFEETYTSSNGELSAQLLQGNYSLTLWADDYAYRYENITINSSLFETSYSMYSNNSIWVTAKDSASNVDITGFNIELYNTDRTYTSNDNDTGIIRLNDIESGIYTLKITKTNYTTAEYVVSMTGGSHQSIIGYLLQSEATTTFTVVNSISNAIIEGAQISMFMNINGTWTLISSQNTDITGRAQFSYTSDVEYRFIVDATDYVQKEFFLKPLFNTYTVRLTPEIQSIPDDNIGKWVYEINNSGYFVYNENNAFSISISSGTGTIEYYILNVTDHNGNTESVTCLIAIGCLDNFEINIVDADANDKITVEYWIKETGRAEKYFRKVYSIQDIYNPNTLWGWKDTGEDVGGLEKGFLAMIITIIIVGVASSVSVMVGAPPVTVSGFVLAATVEILALVGFIPSLAAHMIALGCILIVLFGRGEL